METFTLPVVPARSPETHKGDYGKILVIAGSESMIGAPAITALAALRAGSGLVRVACSKEILPHVLGICPFATGFAYTPSRTKDLLAFAEEHDCLAVGPGLGNTPAVKRLVLELLEHHGGPMVLDADALNALAGLEPSEWPKRRNWGNVVLTPHMGEFMRLMGAVMKRGGAIQPVRSDAGAAAEERAEAREKAANSKQRKGRSLADEDDLPCTADGVTVEMTSEAESSAVAEKVAEVAETGPAAPDHTPLAELLAKGTGTVVVLKGHRTVVTDGVRYVMNTTGNAAMATAGSGDVLTGVIAALLGNSLGAAPKLGVLEATALAVHVHGLAGDLARAALCGPTTGGLLATDIAGYVPKAMALLAGGARTKDELTNG